MSNIKDYKPGFISSFANKIEKDNLSKAVATQILSENQQRMEEVRYRLKEGARDQNYMNSSQYIKDLHEVQERSKLTAALIKKLSK